MAIDAGPRRRGHRARSAPLPAGTPTGLTPRADDQGRTVLYEKDVNLDIAVRLQAVLSLARRAHADDAHDRPRRRRPAWPTTRADLKARTDIANEAGVDVFVSVHNNALRATTSGTETFHYYYASAASRRLAVEVQREMVAALGLPDRGVKSAGFYVLRHTVMPAILTESAFLTNPAEALLLADPAVRQRIADAIGRGVQRYAAGGVAHPAAAPADDRPVAHEAQAHPGRLPAGEDRPRATRSAAAAGSPCSGASARRRPRSRPRSAPGAPGRRRCRTATGW